MNWVRRSLTLVCSGSLVPLAMYPGGLGTVLEYLPFAALASAPLSIYTGSSTMWKLLGLQVLWSVILWPIAGWLWRAHREKLVGYGG